MKNITRHTGTLSIIKRLPSSFYGNPRYLAEIDGYRFVTQVDSSHAYALPNYDGKEITVTLGTHYNRLTLNSIEVAA